MKSLSTLVVVGCAALGCAQARETIQTPRPLPPLPRKGEGKPADRVGAIMEFASDRISTQIDAMFDDGDFPAVIQLLKLQAEMYPADYEVWTNLGWMQENVEAYDAALATYVRYKRQNPDEPDHALPEANFYYMRKMYAKVPPLMEEAIKNPKVHANSYRILARSYEKQNMLNDAARVYKALTERDPNDGAAKANLKRVEGKINGTGR